VESGADTLRAAPQVQWTPQPIFGRDQIKDCRWVICQLRKTAHVGFNTRQLPGLETAFEVHLDEIDQ
jgi:hypothetical protein